VNLGRSDQYRLVDLDILPDDTRAWAYSHDNVELVARLRIKLGQIKYD